MANLWMRLSSKRPLTLALLAVWFWEHPYFQETLPLGACRRLPGTLRFGSSLLAGSLALIITAIGGTFEPPTHRSPGPAILQPGLNGKVRRRFRMKRLVLPPVIAHALAWAAFFGVVFWPEGYGGSTRSTDELRATFFIAGGPFRKYLGLEEIILLLVPVALTGLAIWLAWPRRDRPAWAHPALWGLGVLCLAYCCIWFTDWARQALWGLGVFCLGECSTPSWLIVELGIEFIGAFYLPAAVALIVSATIVSMSEQPPDVPS